MDDADGESARTVDDLRDRPPGDDPDDPYEAVPLNTLPDWWRDAVREFERADLRPYRPSRFRDGVLVEPLLSRLRTVHDASIALTGDDVEYGDHWSLVVDGTTVAEFEHRRSPDGYSVYDIESDRVVGLVERHGEASFVLKQSVILAVCFTILLTAVTILFAEAMIAGLGAATDVVALGAVYLQLLAIGFGFQFFNLVVSQAYAGKGDTMTPMIIRSISAVLNIVLNAVLIFGLGPFPELGVVGAGLGTTIATALGSAAFVGHLGLFEPDLSLRVPGRHWDTAIVRKLVAVGSPAIGRKLLQTAVRVPLLAIVAIFGTGVVAAYEVSRRVFELVRTPMWGLEFSASVLVGQNVGKGDLALAETYFREVSILSLAIMLPLFLLMGLFPEPVTGLFVDDPKTIELASFLLRILALGGLGYTIDEAFSGALTGAGDTRWPFYGTVLGLYGVLLPSAYVLGFALGFGLLGIGIALLAEFYVPAAVNAYRYSTGKWTKAKVTDA